MTFYAPVPLSLLYSLRVRPLSWAERGVLHHLYALAGASPDGVTIEIEKHHGEADVTAWTRALGAEGAVILGRLVEDRFFEIVHQGLRVTILSKAVQAPQEPGRTRPASVPPPRSVKPSETPAGRRERNDRADFDARHGATFGRVAAGVSWVEWLQSDDAAEHLAMREVTHPGYRAIVAGVVARGVAPPSAGGSAPVAPPGSAPLSPPHTPPLSPKNKREERGEGSAPPVAPSAGGVAPPGSALDTLREAAGSSASLHGNPELERQLTDQLARRNLSAEVLRMMGTLLATPKEWWRRGTAPEIAALTDLAGFCGETGYDWKPLDWLVTCAIKRTSRAAKPAPVAPVKIPSRDVDPEFAARFRAEIAARFPAAPKDAAHG